jgi:DNA modification methylase
MNIIKVNIKDINPAVYNPRADLKPGDPAYESLKKSIETYGCVEPLIWNSGTKNLVGGHQRFKVLKAQGVEEFEVSVVDLPPEKEKALNIALNKIQGDWDQDKLADLLRELSQVPDFDCGLTGFDASEISRIFDEQLKTDASLDLDPSTELESDGPPVTQSGDLISLGEHRLLCGDSSAPEDLKRLLGDQMVHLLYTDPPYNCRYDSTSRPGQGEGDSKWKPIANDWAKQEDYEAWLGKFFQAVKPHLAAGAPLYTWNGFRQFGPMHSILASLGFHVSNVITWVKPSAAPGYGDYWMGSEFCLYGWLEENGAHRWFGPNNETNVWQVARDGTGDLIHPTQKPIALAQRAIKNSSQRGDIVFDGFAGSGSSIVACQSLERRCYAVEIEPRYCDAIVRRYIKTFGPGSVSAEVFQKYVLERQVTHD